MEQKQGHATQHQNFPSAPSSSQTMNVNFCADNDEFAQRAPPPSYEESQRMVTNVALPPQPIYQAAPLQAPPPVYYGMQNQAYGNVYGAYQPQYYQSPIAGRAQVYAVSGQAPTPVLTLHKGAEIRTTATGAVSIPPPPPGCAPTPAQLAAMQGQPVVVKKKNNSFF